MVPYDDVWHRPSYLRILRCVSIYLWRFKIHYDYAMLETEWCIRCIPLTYVLNAYIRCFVFGLDVRHRLRLHTWYACYSMLCAVSWIFTIEVMRYKFNDTHQLMDKKLRSYTDRFNKRTGIFHQVIWKSFFKSIFCKFEYNSFHFNECHNNSVLGLELLIQFYFRLFIVKTYKSNDTCSMFVDSVRILLKITMLISIQIHIRLYLIRKENKIQFTTLRCDLE